MFIGIHVLQATTNCEHNSTAHHQVQFFKTDLFYSSSILNLNVHEEIQTMIKMLCQDMSNRSQNQTSNEEKKPPRWRRGRA